MNSDRNTIDKLLPLRLMLRFTDPEYEQRFETYYTDFYYRYAQAILGLGLFLLFGDFLVDYLAYPNVGANYYRIQLCVPVLAAGLAYSFLPHAKRYWEPLMGGIVVAISTLIFWILMLVDAQGGPGLGSWVGILNFTILELYCFAILGLRFRHALICGLLILLAFEAVMYFGYASIRQPAIYLSYHVVTMTLIAAGIGWWREFALRQNFAAEIVLEDARLKAEQAVIASGEFSNARENALSLMEATLNATDNGILVVNNEGKITSVNNRFAKMWRIPSDLMTTGDDDVVLSYALDQLEDPEQFLRKVESLYSKPDAISHDTLQFRDGRIFARYSHPQKLNNETVGRVWSFLDVTDQQRAEQRVLQLSETISAELAHSEQQRKQLQALLEASPLSIAVVRGSEEKMIVLNRRAVETFGYTLEDLPDAAHWWHLAYPDRDYRASVKSEWNYRLSVALKTGTVIVMESVVTCKDGSRKPTETYASFADDFGILVLTDLTHKKEADRELLGAKQAAEEANHAKSVFLASMSHELRTPLNSIIGFAQMLEMGAVVPLDPSQKEPIGHILGSGRHLLGLINEVLDLARIETGRIDLALVCMSLDPVIEEVIALSRPAAQVRQITLRHDCHTAMVVRADVSRVRQILLNLLSNAVKYNREGGLVEVSCVTEGDWVRITVTDTGPGIPEGQRHKLFQPFQRLGAEQTDIEGTGIGLVISRKLAEAMGGSIDFDSEVGVGSRFWMELPLDQTAAETGAGTTLKTQEAAAVAMPIVKGKVIYIEDNAVNVTVMQHIFRHLPGVELLTAETAEKGLIMIRESRPDLVLMDINLPGMSGQDALRILKSVPETAAIPVIAVSAAALPRDIKMGLDAGFLEYYTKPLDIPVFIDTLKRNLKRCID